MITKQSRKELESLIKYWAITRECMNYANDKLISDAILAAMSEHAIACNKLNEFLDNIMEK